MDRAAVRIRDTLLGGAIDHVVISGDLTERGRRIELARFEELFGPLQRAGRLSVVPGNHDRLTDDVGARIMRGGRVETHTVPGLHIVRVDSTGPHNKFLLAGHGEICEAVLDGIDAALEAGLAVKINTVALADINRDEIVALCRFAWDKGALPRFIEHMPMSGGLLYDASNELTAAQIRAAVERELGPLTPSSQGRRDAGPARYWHLAGAPEREVGIISAMTEHFCGDCNRLRLTASGDLHACLGHDDATSLRDILRRPHRLGTGPSEDDGGRTNAEADGLGDSPVEQALISAIAAAVSHKRPGHEFQRTGAGAPGKHMISIGG